MFKKRKHHFPSSPAVAAGFQDCPVIGRFQRQQSKTMMSCFSGQSQSTLVFLSSSSSWRLHPGALPLAGSDLSWKGLKVTEHKDAPLVISHNASLLGVGRGLGRCRQLPAPPDSKRVVIQGRKNTEAAPNLTLRSVWRGRWKSVAGWVLLQLPTFQKCS